MAQHKEKNRTPRFWHSRLISIISVAMVLFLIGGVATVGVLGKELQDYVHESMSFTVLLSPDSSEKEIRDTRTRLERLPFVKELEYHSKEEAMRTLSEELGESPEVFLEHNPLSPSFIVRTHAIYTSHPDSIALVERTLKSYSPQQRLGYKRGLIDDLNHNLRTMTLVALGITALLLLISIVLINNTIRLLIYSKRFSIHTMRLVGATPHFIRRPFVGQMIGAGLISALIALTALGGCGFYLVSHYPTLVPTLSLTNIFIVVGVVVVLSVLLSWVSAIVAVNKYLRMDINTLYRV